jgi:hypothetical protein
MASLADIRARLAAQENKSTSNTERTQSENAIYPHWNIAEGTSATVRFLPDGNAANPYFWLERQIIKLPFIGIKGDATSKRVEVQVPCVEMWGESCPILAEVRPWYKDDTLKEMAGKYWKKRSYLFQGFVRQNPIGEDVSPSNPIRRFVINGQIFNIIKGALMDPEMEEMPTDFLRGLDFRITKTTKGQYADYTTSTWARKESALTEVEQAAIENFGLFNLADFLPKKPTDVDLRIMKEMFEASVDGKPYDAERWGAYYKPYGLQVAEGAEAKSESAAPAATPRPQAQTVVADTPWEDEAPAAAQPIVKPAAPAANGGAQDILAMIRARQNKPA